MSEYRFKWLRTVVVLLIPVLFGFGPCGPIAGTQVSGLLVEERISDFQFANAVEHCALEVNVADPHSVTVNCWTVGKQLFVGCKDCADKTWSNYIDSDPFARIKIGENLYPVKLTKMSDEVAIDRAWKIRWGKYGDGEFGPRPEGYWLYHLGSYSK